LHFFQYASSSSTKISMWKTSGKWINRFLIKNKMISRFEFRPGSPDFSCYSIPKRGKIYQITIKCTKWP
jgi:hypothetical protein